MYTVTLKKGEEKRILAGHPWVYANEVSKIDGKDVQGSVCRVLGSDGRFIGLGFINHLSKIIVRILSRSDVEIDRAFFFHRIKAANDFRVSLGYENSYRAVFGENDFIPGLIVDKYDGVLSVQFLSLGTDARKDMFVDILREIFSPECIYERSDVSVREKEGLKPVKGVLFGSLPSGHIITENGIKIKIDVENGQKTGYFLDQRENRAALKNYAENAKVLDLFCNQGGFSLAAAKFGASGITAVDISETALRAVSENAALNGFKNIRALSADVFELLRTYKKSGEKFDLIILDPPAFTKSKDTVKEGRKGYLDINTLALKLLNPNGILFTCSCSQHLPLAMFLDMLKESAVRAGQNPRLVELRMQGKDHSPLLTAGEGLYLKAAVLRV
ncbi:MAG: class I SAM-dependent rRNA methyltransferase [Clostridiales bacterium]|jgi:23S rRNA (cytosine1962-C5)-methyltransferase|nr:class I SAM-dependent rRNA methyltransferase [Clostridiales bacterium]